TAAGTGIGWNGFAPGAGIMFGGAPLGSELVTSGESGSADWRCGAAAGDGSGCAFGVMFSGWLGAAFGGAAIEPPGTGSTSGPVAAAGGIVAESFWGGPGVDCPGRGGGKIAEPLLSWNMCRTTCANNTATTTAPPATKSLR